MQRWIALGGEKCDRNPAIGYAAQISLELAAFGCCPGMKSKAATYHKYQRTKKTPVIGSSGDQFVPALGIKQSKVPVVVSRAAVIGVGLFIWCRSNRKIYEKRASDSLIRASCVQ